MTKTKTHRAEDFAIEDQQSPIEKKGLSLLKDFLADGFLEKVKGSKGQTGGSRYRISAKGVAKMMQSDAAKKSET